uniref:ATP synthase subunit a n=1 Tax=Cernuella virgata TaxID=145650 RepID=A0A1B0TKS9_9EUPU|nr:ATP synthase subunit 6 [Cernuella virgata]
MMTDLFSSLDGAYSFLLWFPSLIVLFLYMTQVHMSSLTSTLCSTSAGVWKEKNLNRFFPFPLLLTVLFMLLMLTNLMGLTPFMYSLSSDLFTMSGLALLMWLMILLSGYIYSPVKSIAHLAPQGAPLGLAPFLVLIETISIMIRPLTLTVRLMANISAGHIVLGLLANSLTAMVSSLMVLPLLGLSIGYMLFEFFVALIQAYIFTLLISLYQDEHP